MAQCDVWMKGRFNGMLETYLERFLESCCWKLTLIFPLVIWLSQSQILWRGQPYLLDVNKFVANFFNPSLLAHNFQEFSLFFQSVCKVEAQRKEKAQTTNLTAGPSHKQTTKASNRITASSATWFTNIWTYITGPVKHLRWSFSRK